MEEGEGSVWDRELSQQKPPAAFAYHERPAPKPSAPKPSAPKAKLSVEQQRRQRSNDVLRVAQEAAAAQRSAYLAPHAEVFASFGARLPAGRGAEPSPLDGALAQPAQVEGVQMRDYQLHG